MFLEQMDYQKKYGLVQWKGRDIVHALTNCTRTSEKDACCKRLAQGRILLERPKVISECNASMGGVGAADMRRLNCDSTLMGKHR